MSFQLYILESKSSGKYYIGQTSDIEKRLEAHNTSSRHTYTSKYRPWILVANISFQLRSDAMVAEKYLKKKNREFIQRVIQEADLRVYIYEKYNSVRQEN